MPVVLSDAFVPTGTAARLIGVSDVRIRQLVRTGALTPAYQTPLGLLFDRDDCERLAAARAAARRDPGAT